MDSSLKSNPDWIFRIFDRRIISINAKNDQVRKVAAVDILTGLPFGVDVTVNVSFNDLNIGKTYHAQLKVYTSRNVQEVAPEHIDFFKILDVDQTIEDFIKAYWLYPKLVKFELATVEPSAEQ